MGALCRLGDEIRRLLQDQDEGDSLDGSEIDTFVEWLKSPTVKLTKVRHLALFEMEDLPEFLTIIQRRILLKCFKNAGQNREEMVLPIFSSNHAVTYDIDTLGAEFQKEYSEWSPQIFTEISQPVSTSEKTIEVSSHVVISTDPAEREGTEVPWNCSLGSLTSNLTDKMSNAVMQHLGHTTLITDRSLITPDLSVSERSYNNLSFSTSDNGPNYGEATEAEECLNNLSSNYSANQINRSANCLDKDGSQDAILADDEELRIQTYSPDKICFRHEYEFMTMENGKKLKVLKMRSDGDCLFAAVTHQLSPSKEPYDNIHALAIMKAREFVVGFLKHEWRNNETLKLNILDSCTQSPLEYSQTSDEERIEAYLDNLEQGNEWGGVETLKALAEAHKCVFQVFVEGNTSFKVKPEEESEESEAPCINIAFRWALDDNSRWNHYDVVVEEYPTPTPSENSEEETDFTVKTYFSEEEWNSFSLLLRKQQQNIYDRYLKISKDFSIKPPYFMKKKEKMAKTQKPKKVSPTRKSDRLVSLNRGADQSKANNGNSEHSPTLNAGTTQPTDRTKRHATSPTKKHQHQMNKKPRLFGKKLVYPTNLPNFGYKAQEALKKPAMKRNITWVLADSKSFLREEIKGEYISKSEYEAYSRTLVEKYPQLANNTAGKPWWSFKKSLSASFRDDRKKHKEEQASEENAELNHEIPAHDDQKIQELSAAKDRRRISKLLIETKPFRERVYKTLSLTEQREKFHHLSIAEMVLLDYVTLKDLNLEQLESNLEEALGRIGNHFGIPVENAAGKMRAANRMHEFFLTPAVKKGAKAVFNLVDKSTAYKSLLSSDIQAPFLVAYVKQDAFIDDELLGAVAISMQGRLIVSINKPTAEKALIMLMAVYFIFNVEYPKPYMEFLRALERYTTGCVSKSAYRNTKAKFHKFDSLISSQKK